MNILSIFAFFILSSGIVAQNMAMAQSDTARSATVAAFAAVSAPTGDFSSSYQVGFAIKLALSKPISPSSNFILDFSAAWNNFKEQELQSQLPTDLVAQINVPPMKSLYLMTGINYVISASANQQLNASGEIGAECILPSTMTINFPAQIIIPGILVVPAINNTNRLAAAYALAYRFGVSLTLSGRYIIAIDYSTASPTFHSTYSSSGGPSPDLSGSSSGSGALPTINFSFGYVIF